MKRVVMLLIFIVLITACGGPYSSTTSLLVVVEKGHSNDYQEYWIKAYNPQSINKDEAFKIVVNEVMTWNLIVEDVEYIATYVKEGHKPIRLIEIEYFEQTLKKIRLE